MLKPVKCKVHKLAMVRKQVTVRYGYPPSDPAWMVMDFLFPNSNSYEIGGCLVDPDFPRTKRKWVCPACREAERTWRKENSGR